MSEDAEVRIDKFLIQFSSKYVKIYCNYKEVTLQKVVGYFSRPSSYN